MAWKGKRGITSTTTITDICSMYHHTADTTILATAALWRAVRHTRQKVDRQWRRHRSATFVRCRSPQTWFWKIMSRGHATLERSSPSKHSGNWRSQEQIFIKMKRLEEKLGIFPCRFPKQSLETSLTETDHPIPTINWFFRRAMFWVGVQLYWGVFIWQFWTKYWIGTVKNILAELTKWIHYLYFIL